MAPSTESNVPTRPAASSVSPGVPDAKILPVPGVLPHLWHKYQHLLHKDSKVDQRRGAQDPGSSPPASTAPTTPATDPVHSGKAVNKSSGVSGSGAIGQERRTPNPTPTSRVPSSQVPSSHTVSPVNVQHGATQINMQNSPAWSGARGQLRGARGGFRGFPNQHYLPGQPAPPKTFHPRYPYCTPPQRNPPFLGHAFSRGPMTHMAPPRSSQGARTSGGSASTNRKINPAQVRSQWVYGSLMNAPDLVAFPMPRPNYDYSGSSRPSLSPGSTQDGGSQNDRDGSDREAQEPDVRGRIAPEHTIQVHHNSWVKPNWDGQGDHDEALQQASYLKKFIHAWLGRLPAGVIARILDLPGHWYHDIDTNTGLLIPPVEYPHTMVDIRLLDPATAWRQQNWTTGLLVKGRELAFRRSMASRKANGCAGPANDHHVPPQPPAVEGGANERVPSTAQPAVASPKPSVDDNKNNDDGEDEDAGWDRYSPKIRCHLRPATPGDMEGVRTIYNFEVENGLQAADTEPLPAAAFHKILATAREAKMPFIVVVSGPYVPAGATHRESAVFGNSRMGSTPRTGQVLAFGFMSVWEPGLGGDLNGKSRMTARVHVHVHPSHRGKNLGHACLDKLLSTVSYRHAPRGVYDFVNPDEDPVYMQPRHHDRKYYAVMLHHHVRNKCPRSPAAVSQTGALEEKETDRFEDYLQRAFLFYQVAKYEACHRSGGFAPIWIDVVVYKHICQHDLHFTQF
ncbi:hypothetical protein VTK73DRAFT_9604 [Phialemonium thermophilum]|uniref:N-acetyltransferase domain-containing protein n=1 Tax=Phialemonium thermophilum TaxID=223376 RepID=A0ABR3W1G0_9PEZI